ncbi:MAG: response regulator [Lachnospiraceae bacterium]|nr:response regulator [Lachnospiraceae bacterium]
MKTVLIVEDEKMIRQGIRAMIQRSGVPVEVIMECGNGEMALDILRSQKVDVMFTDIRMPKMTGIELVKSVQELDEKPLIVAVSGYADFSYAVEMLRMGAREYLLKPVEREKLWEIMRKLEQEILEVSENSRTSKRLGHQQLKYLMLNERITEEELYTMQTEYESEFELHAYQVCVLNPKDIETPQEQPYIYLHNIEGDDVYLVPEKNTQLLLKNELSQEYVGVSLLHSGIRELRTAYREAVDARRRAFCTNRMQVYAKEPVKHVPEEFCGQGQKLTGAEMKLQRVQLVGTDKTEELVKAWNGLFHAVRNEWIKPSDFVSSMDEFFMEAKKTYRNVLEEEREEVKRLKAYYAYPALAVWQAEFMEWLLALHEQINSRFDSSRNQQKIKQAIAYIQENYDRDLNMAVVSNHISMNYSLFSYLFKEYTGSNFVNYLKAIRMEEAKRLLAETDLRIIEISAKIGYDNEKHFMKLFKASCGVSPSEYRKNVQNGQIFRGGGKSN